MSSGTVAPEGFVVPIEFKDVEFPVENSNPFRWIETDLRKGDMVRIGTSKLDWVVDHVSESGGSVFLGRTTGNSSFRYRSSKTIPNYDLRKLTRSFSIRAEAEAKAARTAANKSLSPMERIVEDYWINKALAPVASEATISITKAELMDIMEAAYDRGYDSGMDTR